MITYPVSSDFTVNHDAFADIKRQNVQMDPPDTKTDSLLNWRKLTSFRWLLLLLVFLSVGELLLRVPAVANVLPNPAPRLWHALLVQDKLDYLAEAAESHRVDVLFVGNSTTQAGVNPTMFDATVSDTARTITGNMEMERGVGSFNASIEGLPPFGTELFLPIYLKRALPATIIYGVTPQDLNANSPWAMDVTERLTHSPMVLAESERGWRGWFLGRLLRYSELFRYRPILMQVFMTGTLHDDASEDVYFDRQGHDAIDRRLADLTTDQRTHLYNKAGVLNYSVNGVQQDALRRTVAEAQARGIQIVLVNMPLADDYYHNFDNVSDYEQYMTALTHLAAEADIPLWNMEGTDPTFDYQPFSDDEFADLNHLNANGAERLSTLLAQRYLTWQSDRGYAP